MRIRQATSRRYWAGLRPRIPILLFGATLAVHAPPASAAETDFLPDNDNWNGLSALVRLARGMQIPTVLAPTLDWGDLSSHDVLVLIHPTEAVDPPSFAAFIRGGGRAIVADDFGRAGRLLAHLGIRRWTDDETHAASHHLRNPALPLATPPGAVRHPLTEGVPYVLTNHPAYFSSSLPTLLGFGAERQVLVAGRIGRGTFIALSDPSVLINAMLRFEQNLTFATNLLRDTCQVGRDRLVVVTGFFVERGRVTVDGATGSRTPLAQRLNSLLARTNDFAFTEAGMRALGLVGTGLLLLAIALLLPLPQRPLVRTWFVQPSEYSSDLARSEALRASTFSRAAEALRSVVEEALGGALKLLEPLSSVQTSWILARIEQRAGPAARREGRELLRELSRLPPPPAATERETPRRRPQPTMKSIRATYERADRLLRALGAPGLPSAAPQATARAPRAEGNDENA